MRSLWIRNDGTVYKTGPYAANGERTDNVDHKWIVTKFKRIVNPFLNEEGKAVVLRLLTENLESPVREVVADLNVALEKYGK